MFPVSDHLRGSLVLHHKSSVFYGADDNNSQLKKRQLRVELFKFHLIHKDDFFFKFNCNMVLFIKARAKHTKCVAKTHSKLVLMAVVLSICLILPNNVTTL